MMTTICSNDNAKESVAKQGVEKMDKKPGFKGV